LSSAISANGDPGVDFSLKFFVDGESDYIGVAIGRNCALFFFSLTSWCVWSAGDVTVGADRFPTLCVRVCVCVYSGCTTSVHTTRTVSTTECSTGGVVLCQFSQLV